MKRVILSALFLAWGFLAFHSHAADAGQMHADHSPCQTCSVSHKIFQTPAPAPAATLWVPNPEIRYRASEHFSTLSLQDIPTQPSRGPPQ